MSNQIKYDPEAACDYCGKFGAYDLGDKHLCTDCYCEMGSCCLEFGGHDLWTEEKSEKNEHVKEEKT